MKFYKIQSLAKVLGQALIKINAYHGVLVNQMNNLFTKPLEQYLEKELKESKDLSKQHGRVRLKYDQSIQKYSEVRKDLPIEKYLDIENEFLIVRNEYQQSSLYFFSKLNHLLATSKLQVIERACSFLSSEKDFLNKGFSFFLPLSHFSFSFPLSLSLPPPFPLPPFPSLLPPSFSLFPMSRSFTFLFL